VKFTGARQVHRNGLFSMQHPIGALGADWRLHAGVKVAFSINVNINGVVPLAIFERLN